VRTVVAPALFFVVFVALWQARVFNDLLGLETFAVPLPGDILDSLVDDRSELWRRFGETFDAAALGYVLGNGVGFAGALVLLTLPRPLARRAGTVCAAVQALPIIAVAPLISLYIDSPLWFKATTVMVLVSPSMLIYAYRGMTSTDPVALELMESYRASPLQVLRRLRLPGAVPGVFTALKYTTVLTLIGVVVCEILTIGDGLGFEIHDSLQAFSTARAWAAVAILAGVGILAYSALMVIERLVFPWSVRGEHRN
jgi:NitT/TauT family transport system permease protein